MSLLSDLSLVGGAFCVTFVGPFVGGRSILRHYCRTFRRWAEHSVSLLSDLSLVSGALCVTFAGPFVGGRSILCPDDTLINSRCAERPELSKIPKPIRE